MFSGHLPPLLLHAGGGGGTGDMPCLPHLKATNTVRMISIVKIQVRIELRKSERLPLLTKFLTFENTYSAFSNLNSGEGQLYPGNSNFQNPVIFG